MDRTPPPTAAELGLTEIEYERIMRGLRQRDQAFDAEGRELLEPAAESQPVSLRRPRWFLPAVGLLVLVLALMLRTDPGSEAPAHAFLHTIDGEPVTHSSCKPLPVAIYPAGGPPDAEKLVREAVAMLRPATGLDIVVVGVFGGHAPNWNFEMAPLLPDDPISVSWQDGTAIARLTDEVVGLGGSRVATSQAGTPYLVSGTIALSREFYARKAAAGDHADELGVLLHEFGHVLGLGHVDSRRELMHPSTTGSGSFGPGDLEGLRRAGHGPCV